MDISIHICWITLAVIWTIALTMTWLAFKNDHSSFGLGGCLEVIIVVPSAIILTLSIILFHVLQCCNSCA